MHRKSMASTLLLFTLLSVAVVQAQPAQTPCTPGVSFWSLLDAVEVGYADGRLHIGKLYAVCLPAPAKRSTSAYEYDPDAGGKLTTVVKSADGKIINTYVWYGHNITSLWELSSYKVLGGHQAGGPQDDGGTEADDR